MRQRYSISEEEYEKTIKGLQEMIQNEPQIIFAYLHGSFIERSNFGDLDLALFVNEIPEKEFMSYEFDLERLIERVLVYPADVRILNNAPSSFCYTVIKKGIKLIDNNEDERANFEIQTYQKYFDFLPFRRRYLKEAFTHEI
jgi:predicted nucleotidyltransferase